MAETDAERFRKEAEDCRTFAEKATNPLDKETWVWLAADWIKLAQEAERHGAVGSVTKSHLTKIRAAFRSKAAVVPSDRGKWCNAAGAISAPGPLIRPR